MTTGGEELLARLPFPLHPERMARYENGSVLIADRRRFPFEEVSLRCDDVEQVAAAIEDMVTQGAGPPMAAACALVMVADRAGAAGDPMGRLRAAHDRLVATRPTNTGLRRVLDGGLAAAAAARGEGRPLAASLHAWLEETRQNYYRRALRIAGVAAELVEAGDGVLTMCFAEASFVLAMAMANEAGKDPTVYVPETRPYLQGARLTAPCLVRMGVRARLVTDGMPAFLMTQGRIQKYMTAADVVTMDGHVVNKVGTYLCAIAARRHRIPYYVLSSGPDPACPGPSAVVIEERDPAEVRSCRGVPTTGADVDACYPAFDITPPDLVAGIVTEQGVLEPLRLCDYYPPVGRR
jgi:methylthioribose-1-phosphate isomerase